MTPITLEFVDSLANTRIGTGNTIEWFFDETYGRLQYDLKLDQFRWMLGNGVVAVLHSQEDLVEFIRIIRGRKNDVRSVQEG